jgi:adenine-specific DNA-methyltransferase
MAYALVEISTFSAIETRAQALRPYETTQQTKEGTMPELYFKGKEFVYNHHLTVPYRPLETHPDKSVGEDSGNLIIHGDNLHALKALLPHYAGKVDCIFIDPPYNTGNENWCYNDNVNSPIMREWLSSNPINREDMLRHDKWACLMYPRLKLLHELMAEDGVIFVSIDDNEVHHLRMLMNDIWGDEAFIAQFIWKSRQNKDNRNITGASIDHEYVLCYGKQIRGSERKVEQFSNPDDDKRGAWSSGNMVGLATEEGRPNLHYDLVDPATGINYGRPRLGWRYDRKRMAQIIEDKRIIWPPSPEGRPREKVFLDNLQQFTGYPSIVGDGIFTRNGTFELDSIFGKRVFEFPKPSSLLAELIEQATTTDSIILDSFAGSGTTAHAVLALNAKDGGNRNFILVECEEYADTLTAERVRRVINGYEFEGTQKEELFRKKVNFSTLKDAPKLLREIEHLEQVKGKRFDKISKTIKNDELLVIGEKKIIERTEGLGGGFTYCTLGQPLDLDKLLTGEQCPDYRSLGAWLFHTATGEPLSPANVREEEWYLGESPSYHVWLIYRPDLDWLKSRDAALTLTLAEKIAATDKEKRHLVFAPARFVASKHLLPLGVEHAPLPFALYRFEKD